LQEFPTGAAPAPATASASAGEAPAAGDRTAQLARLEELHASGAISDDEFERAKKIALN
jgi:hypothetical protein